MRFTLLFLLQLSISISFGQSPFSSFDSSTRSVNSIDPNDTNYVDLEFLKPILQDKRVILLGEQEHGDGASFSAKIRLIKFLNKEMGFNVVAFETGFYKALTSWDLYTTDKIDFEQMIKGTLQNKQWIMPLEMQPLFEEIRKGDLTVSGIDLCYDLSSIDQQRYMDAIDSIELILSIKPNPKFNSAALNLFQYGINSKPSDDEKGSFIEHLDSLTAALSNFSDNYELQFWRQELKGLKALGIGWWQKDAHTRKNWWSSQNYRDAQMAENIEWLLTNKFKGEKVIVWVANYHASRNVSTQVKKDKYFQNDNAISMGESLFHKLGNKMYAIGICSYSGERTIVEHGFETNIVGPKSKNSFEHYLHNKNYEYAFVDFSSNRQKEYFGLAGLFHYELSGNWVNVFDGLIFINKMTPLTIDK